jgi:DNA topoisomerase 2-associated protein PAT1
VSLPPFESFAPANNNNQHTRVRTLAEIEAEQKVAAQLARMSLGSNHGSPHISSSLAAHHEQSRDFRHSPLLQQSIPVNGHGELDPYLRAQRQHEEQQQKELLARQHQLRQEEMLHEQQLQELEYHQQRQRRLEIQQQQKHLQFQQQQVQQQRLLQQQLLSAQTGMPRPPSGHPLLNQLSMIEAVGITLAPEEREALMNEAMNKIVEAERMEERRRRRLAKITKMVRAHLGRP